MFIGGRLFRRYRGWMCIWSLFWATMGAVSYAHAVEPKTGKTVHAVVTDAQGVETDLNNVVFYWEEKVSDTSFVPHEVRHLPAKRGTSLVNIKFDTIAQIEVKQGAGKDAMTFIVTLTNAKKGEFVLGTNGTFRGESDFGQVDVPMSAISKIVFQ